MRKRTSRITSLSVFLSLVSLPAFAQTSGAHLQLSDANSGWVILVNDSPKPIEAFTAKATCGAMTTTPTYDALGFSGGGSSHPAVHGQQPAIIQPGQRFFASVNLAPQPSGCAWHAQVEGVIYTDGSYDGDESAVRDLQARRAGIAAALQYWTNNQLGAHEQTISTNASANAENLSQDDLAKTWTYTCRDETSVCSYWSGRRLVDQNVAQLLKRNAQLNPYLDHWSAKFESDEAFRKLEVTFPTPVTERDAATRLSSAR